MSTRAIAACFSRSTRALPPRPPWAGWRHAGVRHQYRALRNDARKRTGADGGVAGWAYHSHGYDLTRLFVGFEGTLGVITEVTVRLYGMPAAMSSATCSFPSMAAAVRTAIRTIQAGVPVARMELANAAVMDAVKQYSKLDRPVASTLWLDFHGTKAGVAEQAETVRKIAAAQDGANFCWTPDPEGRGRMWQARYDAFYALQARYPGTEIWVTDACVPISRLAECITETEEDLAASGLPAAILGHVGDGNFQNGLSDCGARRGGERNACY
jgi:D-lactate dehydrogenase (cytochrome)